MEAYENGAHAYHATLPTDGISTLRQVMAETQAFGFDKARDCQIELGERVRKLITSHGFPSVAATGFEPSGDSFAKR